jgi:dTDP-4-amino-4,6-dideoxygalactose transaminase
MIELETDTPVIYDAAHGFGLDRLGNRGIAEVVSFSYTKAVTGMQGGVILTNDGKLARKARKLVNLYAKLTEINSYICLKSIEDYNANCIKRWDAVEMYCSLLDDPYQIQEIPKQTNLSVFSILLENKEKKDRVAEKFIKNGIEVKIYYKPLANTLENTNQIYRQIISLPTWDGVEKHIPEICEIINNA